MLCSRQGCSSWLAHKYRDLQHAQLHGLSLLLHERLQTLCKLHTCSLALLLLLLRRCCLRAHLQKHQLLLLLLWGLGALDLQSQQLLLLQRLRVVLLEQRLQWQL